MAKAIKRRRGTTEEHKTFVGLDGEITVDTTKKTLVLHDQETAGGFPLASEAMLNESVEKIEEEAEQTFVHKTGDEEIGGTKKLTSIPKIVRETPKLILSDPTIQKGTNPSLTKELSIRFTDKTAGEWNSSAFGRIGSVVQTNGDVQVELSALKNDASSTDYAYIAVGIKNDGTKWAQAPTAAIQSNGMDIATTNWVRQAFPDWLSNNPSTSINADDQAAIHNGIYRGKNLTSVYTLEQLSAKLQAGDFTDLYIGDYITKPFTYNGTTANVNWRFAHFNYWKYMGDTQVTANHILMVPDKHMYVSQMQETNTTEGGVRNTIVWKALQNEVFNAVNDSSCMNGHVLEHRDWIPTSVNTTAPSMAGWGATGSLVWTQDGWCTVKLGLMKEPMVYTATVHSSSGWDVGCGKSQLALFRLDPTWITGRSACYHWWLGAVTSSTAFAYAGSNGSAGHDGSSDSLGVRPYFLFA